jgi:DNA-directed RNA polymerase subunit RPC12/RpoP
MPVRNTACPYCGSETLANVPDSDTKIKDVERTGDAHSGYYDSSAACSECGNKFYIAYK